MHAPAPSPSRLTQAGFRAVLGLGATQIIHWGSVFYCIAVLGPAICADLSLAPEIVYGGLSLALVAGSFTSAWSGRLIDRLGGRHVMAGGSLACALGLAMLASASGVWSYAAAWLVLGLAMPVALYEAAFASLSQVEPVRARRAVTYLTFLGGLASTVFWPLSGMLLSWLGWRGTLLAYAAASLIVCVPLHLLVLTDRGFRVPDRSPLPPPSALLEPADRPRAFRLMALALLLQNFISAGFAVHLINVLTGLGLSSAAAVTVGTFLGPAQVSGRLAEMAFGEHRPAIWTGLAAWGLLPLSFALLLGTGAELAAAAAFSIIYGVSNGLTTIARGTIPLALFGARGYGSILGRLAAPARLAGALGPVVYAAAGARFGAAALLWLSLAVSLAGFASMLALWRHAAAKGHDAS